LEEEDYACDENGDMEDDGRKLGSVEQRTTVWKKKIGIPLKRN